MWTNEITLVGAEELPSRDRRSALQQPINGVSREPPTFLQAAQDGPLPEINLVGEAGKA